MIFYNIRAIEVVKKFYLLNKINENYASNKNGDKKLTKTVSMIFENVPKNFKHKP